MKHQPYPSIEQFRSVVRAVRTHHDYAGKDPEGNPIYSHTQPYPTLTFTGTVKVHGTNAACVRYKDGTTQYQSRERLLSLTSDNAGFMLSMLNKDLDFMFRGIEFEEYIAVYGEWAGCFSCDTPIRLADGTTRRIGQIVNNREEVFVQSYNFKTGRIEPKKVINWYKNGRTNNWLTLTIKRRWRGGKTTRLVVTPNHSIFIKDGGRIVEKQAGELKVGDVVLMAGKMLTYQQKQFLMGSLLGDASFINKAGISITHSEETQTYYNTFIEQLLNNLITNTEEMVSGHGSNMKKFHITSHPEFRTWFDEIAVNESKEPTEGFLDKLHPIALAAWYMDDGSLINPGGTRQFQCNLHTLGFKYETNVIIRNWFNKHGYECYLTEHNKYLEKRYEIRFTPNGAKAFLHTIAPYVIEGFNYKLPKCLQNIPKVGYDFCVNEYEQSLVETYVETIEQGNPYKEGYKREKYDIEVEDNHNYFANNILVHNSNIQKGVAINGLPKMFIIFGCKVDGNWIPYRDRCDNTQDIYNVHQFQTFELEIDFERPDVAQNELVRLTENVEAECPVGKYFGRRKDKDECTVGEGIVWSCDYNGHHYQMKTKGEKHSVSKVTTIAAVDTAMVDNIQELVTKTVTENRLLQGVEKMRELGKEIDLKTTADFLRWVVNDVIKEEQDTIVASQIDPKKLNSSISVKARMWWLNHVNSNY